MGTPAEHQSLEEKCEKCHSDAMAETSRLRPYGLCEKGKGSWQSVRVHCWTSAPQQPAADCRLLLAVHEDPYYDERHGFWADLMQSDHPNPGSDESGE